MQVLLQKPLEVHAIETCCSGSPGEVAVEALEHALQVSLFEPRGHVRPLLDERTGKVDGGRRSSRGIFRRLWSRDDLGRTDGGGWVDPAQWRSTRERERALDRIS